MSGYGGNQYTQQQQQQYAAVPQGDMYAELLAPFWEQQVQEVGQVGRDAAEFKNHQLPLARIKKVGACIIAWHVMLCQHCLCQCWCCCSLCVKQSPACSTGIKAADSGVVLDVMFTTRSARYGQQLNP